MSYTSLTSSYGSILYWIESIELKFGRFISTLDHTFKSQNNLSRQLAEMYKIYFSVVRLNSPYDIPWNMSNMSWDLRSLELTIKRLERETQKLESRWLPDFFRPSVTPHRTNHMAKVILLQNLKILRDQMKLGSH